MDQRQKLRKCWVFLFNHEEPVPPTILLSTRTPVDQLVDEHVKALPLCQKRMLLNWTNSFLMTLESHRNNSVHLLGKALINQFRVKPLWLNGHLMNVSPTKDFEVVLEGEILFVHDLVIKPQAPNPNDLQFTAKLKGTVIPGKSRLEDETVKIEKIYNISMSFPTPIDETSLKAFQTDLETRSFETTTMSRSANYAMYLYDILKIIKEADENHTNIMTLTFASQIDRAKQFLRENYQKYVETLSETEIVMPPFEYTDSFKLRNLPTP